MKIVHYPHPSLRHVAQPLRGIDKKVQLMVGVMLDLMYEAKGLGLAAPQVCLPYQLLVMNHSSDPNQREDEGIYINPVILERTGSVEGEEGCLSFPGLYRKVRRAKTVKVIDKIGPVAKLSARGAIQEFERDYKKAQDRGEIPADKDIEQLLVALEASA